MCDSLQCLHVSDIFQRRHLQNYETLTTLSAHDIEGSNLTGEKIRKQGHLNHTQAREFKSFGAKENPYEKKEPILTVVKKLNKRLFASNSESQINQKKPMSLN